MIDLRRVTRTTRERVRRRSGRMLVSFDDAMTAAWLPLIDDDAVTS